MPEAYRRLALTNSFPEFTGRVCPALCEASCVEGLILEPVAIKNAEAHIIDYMWERGLMKPSPPPFRTGSRAAVVGSGPAGLACADVLNKLGHEVTVFERDDRLGGLLMYGIPNMKLDKGVINRRVELMRAEGVNFVAGREIKSAAELKGDFDAVVLCTGARKARALAVPGAELSGVYPALDFLKAATKSYLDSNLSDGAFIDCSGKNVVVVGGGDTGTDCVATSIRLGAASVAQIEIMPRPAGRRTEANPWPAFPRILKTDYGQEEAIAKFGGDPRVFSTTVVEIIGKDGAAAAVRTSGVSWKSGRPEPEGEITERPADLVLIAMGFLGADDAVADVAKTPRGAYAADGFVVSDGVFAAGDARRGQSLVVWAIKEGREAARECDKRLRRGE
jgi:glutamate synthase (NADPH/NADH) small chain